MIPSHDRIEVRTYQPGDAGRIPVAEADPYAGWLEHVEANAAGLRSYALNGELIAVTYYMPIWDGVADAAALIDRKLAHGHGQELARVIRQEIDAIMLSDGLHRVQATSEPADKDSRIFLRAMGYRQESVMRKAAPDKTDLLLFVILEKDT